MLGLGVLVDLVELELELVDLGLVVYMELEQEEQEVQQTRDNVEMVIGLEIVQTKMEETLVDGGV
jgi:hypothetical protein